MSGQCYNRRALVDKQPVLAKADLLRVRFHDPRHSCATPLLSRGVHAKIVQELLGHSQTSLTMNTYSHVLPTKQQEAARVMEKVLTGT
jgi:integrase